MSTSTHSTSTPSFSTLTPQQRALAIEKARARVEELTAGARSGIEQILLELERRECATLKGFTHRAWKIIEPVKELKWNWHLDVLCAEIERICLDESDESAYTIINVPPGTMKSILFVMMRAWLWSKKPQLRFLSASYGATLSTRDNVKLRDIVLSPWYRRLWPHVVFKGDQNAKEKFETEQKGWSIATSVGGAATGEHPDIGILDDLISEADSRSEKERKAVNDWVDRTVGARGIVRKVKIFMIMQRLHEEDPTGHVEKKGGWRKICFPMRFTRVHRNNPQFQPDPLDQRTQEGELLWPELYDEATVRKLEIKLGPYGTAGQLQQQPAPEGGGQFKREWFKFIDALPTGILRTCRGWDTAGTEDDGDWTVGVKMSDCLDGRIIIRNVVRDRLSPHGVEQLMLSVATLDGFECVHREEKEPGSSGKAVIAAHTKLLRQFDHKGVTVSADKVTRAKPFRAQVEAGNVYILRTGNPSLDAWIEPYIAELTSFPTGANDDQVDASSCAYNQMLLEPVYDTATPFR